MPLTGKTKKSRGRAVLIVDDDVNFRQLLVKIFSPIGLEVVEAGSSDEAMQCLADDLALVIVDYRLPDTDGMTFITRLRQAGYDLPVVFISGAFCDAKTFNWLRNILKVSLVLQKPIEPKLLLEQLESLLPAQVSLQEAKADEARPTLMARHQEYGQLLDADPGIEAAPELPSQESKVAIEAAAAQQETNPELTLQLRQMRKKAEMEGRIRQVQMELRQALPPEWEKLSASISRLQANPLDRESREQSVSLSHRLRGTAGSLGLHRVSACAGKIEDYLIMLDPADSTEYDLLWGEIIRALADGEGGLGAHEAFDGKGQLERFYGGNVLILAEEAKFKEAIVQLGSHVDAKFFFAPTPRSALIKAADTVFDAAVIDLSIGDKTTLFHLSKGLRHSIGNKNLPLACLLAGNDLLEAADQIYLGISAIMQAPVESAELERALRTLSSVRVGQRARILTVDDDQVLTKFIQTILQTAAMQVTALNEPIKIMEVLEEARPDLILMDVIMPGLSGFDVCRMLKQNEKWRSTPLVFLTSKSDAQGRASAFQAGGEDFLSKPILSEELITRVQSQLARYRERHQDCSLDEMSGTLRREAFSLRLQDSLIIAEQGKRKLSLSMIRINGLEQAERYGIFATINAITSLGRLICARFKSDSLRGRWDDNTFLLATADDAAINVVAALRLLAQEFEKQSFTRDDGRPFTVTVTSSTAMYPGDGLNVESLMQTAQDRLLVNSRRNPADGGAISDQDEAAS